MRQRFDGPAPGASVADLVAGFLNATLDSGDDSASARLFLTQGAAAAWQPGRGILVYEAGTSPAVRVSGTNVVVTVPSVATVDADGRLTEHLAGATATLPLTVVRDAEQGGQWRIASLPADFGVWMSQFYFEQLYAAVQVAYAVPGRSELVGDSRFVATTSGMATTLARGLVSDVPAYLGSGVTTGFPKHTTLTVDAVTVESGVARVEMSAQLLDSQPDELRTVWAQTVATLTQVRRVTQVRVEVNGQAVPASGQEDAVSSLSDLGFAWAAGPDTSRIVLRQGEKLIWRTPSSVSAPAEAEGATGSALPSLGAGWQWLALSPAGDGLAAVGGDRRELRIWPSGGRGLTLATPAGMLSRPRFSRDGSLWLVSNPGEARSRVIVISADQLSVRAPRIVSVNAPEGMRLIDVSIAAEGTRIALILTDSRGRMRIGICGIEYDGGVPQEFAPPRWVGRSIIGANSLCWVTEDTVAVVGRRSATEAWRPLLVGTTGETTALPPLADTREVRPWNGPKSVLARAGVDGLYELGGQRWVKVGTGNDILVPGT